MLPLPFSLAPVHARARTLDFPVASILPALQDAGALEIVEETAQPAIFWFRRELTRAVV